MQSVFMPNNDKSHSRKPNTRISPTMFPKADFFQLGQVSTAELRHAKHSMTLEPFKKACKIIY